MDPGIYYVYMLYHGDNPRLGRIPVDNLHSDLLGIPVDKYRYRQNIAR